MADVALPKTSQTGTNEWADVEDNDNRLLDVINKDYDSPFAEAAGVSIDSGPTRRDYAAVATAEATGSASWTDLATPGPSVTITVPSNSLVLIGIEVATLSPTSDNNFVGVYKATDFPITGVPDRGEYTGVSATRTAPHGPGMVIETTASYPVPPNSGLFMIPSTAGSRTYTLKYATTGVSGSFKDRKIWALALGGF